MAGTCPCRDWCRRRESSPPAPEATGLTLAYSGLDKKRDKVIPREDTGKHGRAVDGIAAPATPYVSKSVPVKSAPEAKMRPMPSYGENPFDLNPQLKGFKQAKTWRGSQHFPVNAINFKKRGPVIE